MTSEKTMLELADELERNANDCEDQQRWATPELAPLLRKAAKALRASAPAASDPWHQDFQMRCRALASPQDGAQPIAFDLNDPRPIWEQALAEKKP